MLQIMDKTPVKPSIFSLLPHKGRGNCTLAVFCHWVLSDTQAEIKQCLAAFGEAEAAGKLWEDYAAAAAGSLEQMDKPLPVKLGFVSSPGQAE